MLCKNRAGTEPPPFFLPLIYMGLGCGNISGSRFGAAGCSCLFSPAIQRRPLGPARPLPLICNAERAAGASSCPSRPARAPVSAGREGCPVPSALGRGHALPAQCPAVFSSRLFQLPPTPLAPRGPPAPPGPRRWVSAKQQVTGFATRSASARLTRQCPSPAPPWVLGSEHPASRARDRAEGGGVSDACPAFDGLSRSPANFSQRLPSSSHFCMQQAGPQHRFLH